MKKHIGYKYYGDWGRGDGKLAAPYTGYLYAPSILPTQREDGTWKPGRTLRLDPAGGVGTCTRGYHAFTDRWDWRIEREPGNRVFVVGIWGDVKYSRQRDKFAGLNMRLIEEIT